MFQGLSFSTPFPDSFSMRDGSFEMSADQGLSEVRSTPAPSGRHHVVEPSWNDDLTPRSSLSTAYYDITLEGDAWIPMMSSSMPNSRNRRKFTDSSPIFSVPSFFADGSLSSSPHMSLSTSTEESVNDSKRSFRSSETRLHECPVVNCGKRYRRKGDLKYHITNKHPQHAQLAEVISRAKSEKDGKDFPCPIPDCKCGFKWHRDLKRHMKGKHAEVYESILREEQVMNDDANKEIVWTSYNFSSEGSMV
jgi:hypothetical protein